MEITKNTTIGELKEMRLEKPFTYDDFEYNTIGDLDCFYESKLTYFLTAHKITYTEYVLAKAYRGIECIMPIEAIEV